MAVARTPTAEDLRADIARRQIAVYKLAALVGLHPGRLGMILGEKLNLPPALAGRISEAISQMSHGHN